MKDGDMEKIQRVYKYFVTTRGNGRTYKRGPYWRGSGSLNGIQYTIHIGKSLPDELLYLLKERVRARGAKRYKWPGHIKKSI